MIIVRCPASISNRQRPYVFVSGSGEWVDSVERHLDAISKGTLLIPSDNVADGSNDSVRGVWRYRSAWDSDVLVFWFGTGLDRTMELIEFGLHVGRYCAGSGARRVIVGMEKDCSVREEVEQIVGAVNMNLQGPWKFEIIYDFKRFCEKVRVCAA